MKMDSMPKDVSTIWEMPSGIWTGNTMKTKKTNINTISRGDLTIAIVCIRIFAMSMYLLYNATGNYSTEKSVRLGPLC